MDNKKLIIIGGSILGILVVLLVVLWLLSTFKRTYYSYEEVEEKISESTKNYYKKNPEILPVNDGKYTLSYNTLVENKLIKPLNELLVDGNSCNAEIIVIKKNDNYSYIPKLSCADKYLSKELYKQVLNDNDVVTSGSGLYKDENATYYFKGKIDNNYVVLGQNSEGKKNEELLWRIISIDSDNIIRLRAEKRLEEKTVWDDRYNEIKDRRVGYNDFEMSILKEYLKKLESNQTIFNTNQLSKLVAKNLCIAPRTKEDQSTDGSVECSMLSSDEMLFSTLLPYEYIRASLDSNCQTIDSNSCINFNYLSKSASSSWSLTADPTDNYHAYSFDGEIFNSSTTSSNKYIYPVINLSEYAFYKSGNGTISDPYRIFKASK